MILLATLSSDAGDTRVAQGQSRNENNTSGEWIEIKVKGRFEGLLRIPGFVIILVAKTKGMG